MTDIIKLVDAEMKEYSDGAYADHGSAKDQLMRFAELATAPLKAENEALRADAARYQWLRDTGLQGFSDGVPQRGLSMAIGGNVKLHFVYWMTKQELDQALDAVKEAK